MAFDRWSTLPSRSKAEFVVQAAAVSNRNAISAIRAEFSVSNRNATVHTFLAPLCFESKQEGYSLSIARY